MDDNDLTSDMEVGTAEVGIIQAIDDDWSIGCMPQGADTSPPPLHVATANNNHLNEEIGPITPCPLGMASDIAKPYQI
jgi:hypothetical protein